MKRTKSLTLCGNNGTITVSQHGKGTMDEETLVSLLKERGWTLTFRNRRNKGKQYIYARKRQGTTILERYIAPLTHLNELSSDQIIEKLEQSSPKSETAVKHLSGKLRLTA